MAHPQVASPIEDTACVGRPTSLFSRLEPRYLLHRCLRPSWSQRLPVVLRGRRGRSALWLVTHIRRESPSGGSGRIAANRTVVRNADACANRLAGFTTDDARLSGRLLGLGGAEHCRPCSCSVVCPPATALGSALLAMVGSAGSAVVLRL